MKLFIKFTYSFIICLMLLGNVKGQIITTIAGNGMSEYSGDGGAAITGGLYSPRQVTTDAVGNLYIADELNHRIRKVSVNGTITTIAGDGYKDSTGLGRFSGDGGPATSASLNYPTCVVVDTLGNLYIADRRNARIRKVTLATGFISTIAGNGSINFNGDSVAATSANIAPYGVAVDASGNIYIADYNNHRIRKVTASTSIITTLTGNGIDGFEGDGNLATAAKIRYPVGIVLDANNNIYMADYGNNRIRKITKSTGIINTIAGSGTYGFSGDGGSAVLANLGSPYGLAIDIFGNLYIADGNNNRIRKVTVNTGIITSIAGNGIYGFGGDGGNATDARLASPGGINGVGVDRFSNVYVADRGNNRIRKVTQSTLPLNLLTFTAQPQNNTINLSWQTTNEVNTSHFTIQRSVDGTNFNSIGKVVTKGDGGYSYADNQLPTAAVVYYRLQVIDKEGSFTYSKVVAVSLNSKLQTLNLYPNPVKETLFVQFTSTKAEQLTIQIADMQGKVLQQQAIQVGLGNTSTSINTATLATGSYVLLVKGAELLQQKQFVKE